MEAVTPAKRSSELGVKETPPPKVQRVGVKPITVVINCGGRKFECRKETLLNLGSCFFNGVDAHDELFLDFKPDAFNVVLDAHRLARTDLAKGIWKIQEGLQKWSADVQDLLQYLGLEWLAGTSCSLSDAVSIPEAAASDEVSKLFLAGILEHLTRNQLSPRTYTGDCKKGEEMIYISEELNNLASRENQKEKGHTDLVAQMLKIKPFSRLPTLGDFQDFVCPKSGTRYEPPSPDYHHLDPYDADWERHCQEEYEQGEYAYYREYGFPMDICNYGVRRHVVDVGSQRFLCLSAVVAAFSGSLLNTDCILQIACSDGRKHEARLFQEVPKKLMMIKVEMKTPFVGRMFTLTVIPCSYSRLQPKTISLEALEFYGTFIDVPKELPLSPQANFRFDDEFDKFRKVEAHSEE